MNRSARRDRFVPSSSEVEKQEPPQVKWLDQAIHRRILVHTGDDRSIEGILTLAADDGLLLWSAVLKGKPEVPLSGEVFIPRSQVLFVQTVRM